MAEVQKYRINTLAKDLNMKAKELIDFADEIGLKGKKTSSNIEVGEYEIIINRLTLKNQAVNYDAYRGGSAKLVKKGAFSELRKPEPAVSEAKPAEKPQQDEKKSAPAEKAEAGVQTGDKNKQVKNTSGTRDAGVNRFEKHPDFTKKDQKKDVKKDVKKPVSPAKPAANVKEEKSGVVLSSEGNQFGRTRTVDTKAGSVDLSKYDVKLESYDDGRRDGGSNKSKFTKKPADQQKGKNGKNNQPQKNDRKKVKFDNHYYELERKKQEALERARKQQLTVSIPDEITVGELASRLKATTSDVVKKLFSLGVMATVNQVVDYDTAYFVADEMGAKVVKEVSVSIEEQLFENEEDSDDKLVTRAPVVVVMGHVDHGKTSILDSIRKTNVTSGEAGGITQAIGAYRVNVNGQPITFLDTPGHEAFTAMRARGAMATDIAILVVAADDGIMPQTIEAINHAKAANLDIIVAINKMDKPGANPEGIKQELTKYDLIPEEWGGDVICVPVSALKGMNIDKLLETVLMVAEMKDLKANPDRRAKGTVIEAKLDKGRGPVATVLVQNGTLHSGDYIIAGTAVGRVRAMKDDNGKMLSEAGPSVPVEIIGLSDVPVSGDEFNAVENEKMAKELADQRRKKQRDDELSAGSKVSLDDLFAQISDGAKELKIVVKADVVGSAEAVKQSLEKLSNEEVKVKVIHSAVGGINEGDVNLASASNAIIIGFNVRPDKNATDAADRAKVDVRTYRIIYECIEEVEAAMKGMLAPVFKEEILGHAEVRQIFHITGVGTIAGCLVKDGKVARKSQIRVLRDSVVIFEDSISSLKRMKDDAKEVAEGYECGIGLEKFNDIKEGDVLEVFEMVEQAKD